MLALGQGQSGFQSRGAESQREEKRWQKGSRVDTFRVCGCAAGGPVCDLTGGLSLRPSCVALGKARDAVASSSNMVSGEVIHACV